MRTICCLLLFGPVLWAQTADEKKATLAYLKTLQDPDGGFHTERLGKDAGSVPTLRATSAGIRAIKYFGGELSDKKKTAAFVLSCYDATSGAFSNVPIVPKDMMDVTAIFTAAGMMAAAEVVPDFDFGPSTKYLLARAKNFEERRMAVAGMEASKKFPDEVAAWIKDVRNRASANGTFGGKTMMPFDTGGAVAMILRSGHDISEEHRKNIIKSLQETQRDDGAYGKTNLTDPSDLETTYRVMRTFHLLKAQPKDTKALRAFIAKCRNADGGYTVQPGRPSAVNSTYYAGIILQWLPE